MKLRVLVDNNTIINQYYLGEPGVSYYIEEAGQRILFDTGYSDIFLRNAAAMDIDLAKLDMVILSHGHDDHTGGLAHLHKLYKEQRDKKPRLLVHPQAFARKRTAEGPIGMPVTCGQLSEVFELETSVEPIWLSEALVFLGKIRRGNDFEGKRPYGEAEASGKWQDDYITEDTALAYRSAQGIVIITGCSHSGICNIIEQAKRVCKEERIAAIIGGFHLLHTPAPQLAATCSYLQRQAPKAVYACHCTDLAAKLCLADAVPLREVGVGLALAWQ